MRLSIPTLFLLVSLGPGAVFLAIYYICKMRGYKNTKPSSTSSSWLLRLCMPGSVRGRKAKRQEQQQQRDDGEFTVFNPATITTTTTATTVTSHAAANMDLELQQDFTTGRYEDLLLLPHPRRRLSLPNMIIRTDSNEVTILWPYRSDKPKDEENEYKEGQVTPAETPFPLLPIPTRAHVQGRRPDTPVMMSRRDGARRLRVQSSAAGPPYPSIAESLDSLASTRGR